MKNKLLKKIELQVTDSESIEDIDSLIDEAIIEADEIINNKDVANAVRFDIAYFRFLLFVTQSHIDETDMEIYKKALEIVKKAPIKTIDENNDGVPDNVFYAKVSTRRSF